MTEIEYEGKKYKFTWDGILIFVVGTVAIALFVWFGTEALWEFTHKIVVEQTCAVINWFTEIGWTNLEISYTKLSSSFKFNIPGRGDIGFENACTGVQAIAMFAGLIIATPHAQDKETNKGIWKRKILSLIVASAIFYVVNILRMVIQLNLYYEGHSWSDIHVSISAASSFIAAVIILLMHKWIPEFVFSILWVISEVKVYFRKRKENTLVSETNESDYQEPHFV
ncbi:MAG: hypothetical protein GF364_16175 [Candidatus Lokiarchaeota archaeon]|nr:hypothetical protein [Candidatus Lokiarchaeota archaeon]